MKKIIVLSFLLIGCAPEEKENKPPKLPLSNHHITSLHVEKDNNIGVGTYAYWQIIEVDNNGVKSRFLFHYGLDSESIAPLPMFDAPSPPTPPTP